MPVPILSALTVPQLVVYADAAFLIVGGLLGVAVAIRAAKTGSWRTPLSPAHAHVLPALPVDFLVFILGAMLVIGLSGQLIATLALRLGDLFPEWQQMLLADAVIKCGGGALAAAVLFWRSRGRISQRDTKSRFPWTLSLVVFLVATPLVSLQLFAEETLWGWFGGAPLAEHHMLKTFLSGEAGELGKIQLVVSATIISPIAEELIFRGVFLGALQNLFRRHWPAILIQGIIFGFMHAAQPQAILPLATFGVILGYVAVRTGSLPACILIHILFNARTMAIAFLAPESIR